MKQATLLLEIGMEECPARFVGPALTELAGLIIKGIGEQRLALGITETFGTPRRLAIRVTRVAAQQEDLEEEVKGPPARIAFDEEGAPTRAAQGFAANQGVNVDDLIVKATENGAYVFAVRREMGRAAEDVLPEVLVSAVTSVSFPKSMQWGYGGLRFARPIRWVVALWGSQLVSLALDGIVSGRKTRGHRFLAKEPFDIEAADDYVDELRSRGSVVVDVAERRETIGRQVAELARSVGGEAVMDDDLLDEVTQLVEYPTALLGSFDIAFLEIPPEILVTTMKEHQRYFPVSGPDGSLSPYFVTVRNGDDAHLDVVRAGNERVLAARLADAKFFYDEDRKAPLIERTSELKSVLFQEELGSVWDKVGRIREIIRAVSGELPPEVREMADRAALLCKADLVTHVVHEFPELQGLMGREYAGDSGEAPAVAAAVYEHYMPRHAHDDVPASQSGALVSLADKIDTIAGCFGIGLVPTGSADPYALRRQALGIIRTQVHHRFPVSLNSLLDAAISAYGDRLSDPSGTRRAVLDFFAGRLRNLLIERGIRHDLVDAALSRGAGDLLAVEALAEALAQAAGTEAFASLTAAFQRAANLAKKGGRAEVTPDLFVDREEKALWQALVTAGKEAREHVAAGRFGEAIEALAHLRTPVDAFFDTVLVMAEDRQLRENRLAILTKVVEVCLIAGDLGRVTES